MTNKIDDSDFLNMCKSSDPKVKELGFSLLYEKYGGSIIVYDGFITIIKNGEVIYDQRII